MTDRLIERIKQYLESELPNRRLLLLVDSNEGKEEATIAINHDSQVTVANSLMRHAQRLSQPETSDGTTTRSYS